MTRRKLQAVIEDRRPDGKYVAYAGKKGFPLPQDVVATNPSDLVRDLADRR